MCLTFVERLFFVRFLLLFRRDDGVSFANLDRVDELLFLLALEVRGGDGVDELLFLLELLYRGGDRVDELLFLLEL